MTEYLLFKGVNPNIQSMERLDTPLHMALERGHIQLAVLLLNSGAESYIVNKNGKTPLDLVSKLDRIKLERCYAYHKRAKSCSGRGERSKYGEWDNCSLSSISLMKIPTNDSGHASPSHMSGMSKFLFSTYQTTNNVQTSELGKDSPQSLSSEGEEDISTKFKRKNRRDYHMSEKKVAKPP